MEVKWQKHVLTILMNAFELFQWNKKKVFCLVWYICILSQC
jgi:hypothetical protein